MNHPNPHFLAHEMVVVVVSHQQKHCCNVVVVLVVVVMVLLLLTGQHHPCPCRRVVHSVRDGDDHDAVPVPAFHERYDCRNQSIMHVATLHKHRWNDHPMQCTPMPNEHDPWPNDHSTLHTIERERESDTKRETCQSVVCVKNLHNQNMSSTRIIFASTERERERDTQDTVHKLTCLASSMAAEAMAAPPILRRHATMLERMICFSSLGGDVVNSGLKAARYDANACAYSCRSK